MEAGQELGRPQGGLKSPGDSGGEEMGTEPTAHMGKLRLGEAKVLAELRMEGE